MNNENVFRILFIIIVDITNKKLRAIAAGRIGFRGHLFCVVYIEIVRDEVREARPVWGGGAGELESMPNGRHHTVLPICWSLAPKRTCGHPEAFGRGGLSLLSAAHHRVPNFLFF